MNHVTSLKCEQVVMKDARKKRSNKIYDNLSLGSFEGLQHNPQPQLSFDTQCKKVLGSSFTNHTPRTFPSRIVICCTLSDLSYLGVFSTGFFFMWDSPAFLPYTMIWYMDFHPHQCFFTISFAVALWFSTLVSSSRFAKSFLRLGLAILEPWLR